MSEDFRKEVHDLWDHAERGDHDNREEALLDLKIAANEQWDDVAREMRENPTEGPPRPCLTINTTLQYINQVTGDRLANQSSIKVVPREDGDVAVADVRSELIRAIEHHSKAQRVYRQAFEQAVTCGIGNFRVDLDYAYEDAFERDIFIRGIPNPLSVMWDPQAADPTAKDATFCFVADRITREEYTKRFPDAAMVDMFDSDVKQQGWCDDQMIRVAEYWKIEERDRTIALFADGSVKDVTDRKDDYQPQLYRGPNGEPRIRKAKCKYAVMVLTNGQEELSDPFELKMPRLPIIRVTGHEIWAGDKRVRFGLVRLLRDHQRMKNYLRSVATEKLMFAPRANFIAPASAVKGRTNDWPNTLIYNDGAQEPRPVTETNLAALVSLSEMSAQDMKDVTGIHDASLGVRSNETSGVAIQRRQHEGDIATIGYHDNMNMSQQEAGEVINTMLDIVYDTPRTIRVIGEDSAIRLLRVNDPAFQPTDLVKENIDLSKGRYDVMVATGPSFMSRRQEAAAGMLEFARVSPGVVERAGDLIARSQDWPLADEFAERLRPPGTMDNEDMTPEQQQEQMLQAQQQQQVQAMEMEAATAELDVKKADARKKNAEAVKAEAEAEKAQLEVIQLRLEQTAQGLELAGLATGEIEPEQEMETV
jgi:Phage P22-like portal protein